MSKELVIVGTGEFGEIACDYFTRDSHYEIVAFSAEGEYINGEEKLGKPIIPFSDLKCENAFVAVGFPKLNQTRKRLFERVKDKGINLVSYFSSWAFRGKDVKIGSNCFIFENNTIQHKVELGDNVILWSGNHVGHRTIIGDNCFISSHVVISGYCTVGPFSFLGVNSTIIDEIDIAQDNVIGAGAVITKNTEKGKIYVGNPARKLEVSSYEKFELE